MRAFISWWKWMVYGRAALCGLREELRNKLKAQDETIALLRSDMAKHILASQPPQIVPQSPQSKKEPVQAKNWREFQSFVEDTAEVDNGI